MERERGSFGLMDKPGSKRHETADDASERKAKEKPLDFGLILRLFRYTRRYAFKRNLLFAFVIIRAFQLPALAWAVGAIINGPITRGDPREIVISVLGFGALALFTSVVFHFRMRLAMELGEGVVRDMRVSLYQHLLRMPMSFYNKTRLGSVISRMISDIELVRTGVANVLFVSMVQGGQMIFSGMLMAYYNWRLFIVILTMIPILYGVNRYFRKRFSTATREVRESFSRVTSNLAETVNGIRVTQGFHREDINAGFFRRLAASHSEYNLNVSRHTALFFPILEANAQVFFASILLVSGYGLLVGNWMMSVGDLVMFFFLAHLFFEPVTVIGRIFSNALTSISGAERVFRMLESEPDWVDPEDAVRMETVRGQVEFKDVRFSYKEGEQVLHGIDFSVEAGQTVALVGHTGSGKSSIINLLCKFYLPDSGQVLIDGLDLQTVKTQDLRSQIGMVLQSNFFFTGTILDNVRLAKPEATEEEVRAVFASLGCLDLIEAMPDGLMTEVSEKGRGLSLGQQQLVCFARAFIVDPRILILDEATSSVDSITEARLQKAMSTLLKGRTSFVVAHRLSTIRNADQVLVLDHGRVIERGNHRSLLQEGGVYAGLYRRFVNE